MPVSEDDGTDTWGALDGLPGNPMVWILILGELAVFGVLLVGFEVAALVESQTFDSSAAFLDPSVGALNTLVLLASGWLAAGASERIRTGRSGRARLVAAIALGMAFLAVKAVEYGDKFSAGIGIETNTFFTLYFLITGFHALHVLAGCAGLAIAAFRPGREIVETATSFWHMVDMLWVVIFPVVYLA